MMTGGAATIASLAAPFVGAPLIAAPGKQVQISSIKELRKVMQRSNQKIRMKPGTYTVNDTLKDDDKTVFRCSGSNNWFDLRGVTIQVPTGVLSDMPNAGAHALGSWRIPGNHNRFLGATFRNTGDEPPRRGLSEFSVTGDHNSFRKCTFIIRGSAPYGYGDMYGKGGDNYVGLHKHSAMAINGDNNLVESCTFDVKSFGHGIHMHGGATNTRIRDVQLEGILRHGTDIYTEENGPAADYDYEIYYPKWERGEPIPKNRMIPLTEDGIRAYDCRKTTIEQCTVRRMRGGITMVQGKNTTVTNCTVLDCGYGYSLPSNGTVGQSGGNASVGPLIRSHYSNRSNFQLDLRLIPAKQTFGEYQLANLVGSGHRVKLRYDGPIPDMRQPILVGWAWGQLGEGRWAADSTDADTLSKSHRARDITLVNQTPHPVILTRFSKNCAVRSKGPVKDRGSKNHVKTS